MRHRTTSAELELEVIIAPLQRENLSLQPLKTTHHSAPLHWCHDYVPHSGTISYPEPVRIRTQLTKREVSSKFYAIIEGNNELHLKYAYHCSCLVSACTIFFAFYHSAHVNSLQYKNTFTM